MWDMKEVIVIPVVAGALGAISTGLEKYIAAIKIEIRAEHAQKIALLGRAAMTETGTWIVKKNIVVSITV